jgi:hypothetical protein
MFYQSMSVDVPFRLMFKGPWLIGHWQRLYAFERVAQPLDISALLQLSGMDCSHSALTFQDPEEQSG